MPVSGFAICAHVQGSNFAVLLHQQESCCDSNPWLMGSKPLRELEPIYFALLIQDFETRKYLAGWDDI